MVSKLAVLQDQHLALRGEHDALLAAAERLEAPDKILAALASSEARRNEIGRELMGLDAEIVAETARRTRERSAPAVGPDSLTASSDEIAAAIRRSTESAPAKSPRYADVFGVKPQASGWASANEFLEAIGSGRHHPRLTPMASANVEGIGSDGGFFVPEELTAEILDASLEDEIVRPRATIYPMRTDTRKVAGFDGGDHTDGKIYGLQAVWEAELATATNQKAKTRIYSLIAHKLIIYAEASSELIADGSSFEQQLTPAFVGANAYKLDQAFLRGTGAGMPLGIFNDPALIVVAKEGGQNADTIVVENIDKMFARHYNPLNAVWIASRTTIPQLLGLVRIVGTGGTPVPVLNESNGQFTMLTRPVIFSEKLAALGDQGDLALVDFSQYAIGIRKEMSIDRSNAPGWYEDALSFRSIVRMDGRGRWATALTPATGDTLSWAVTLAARA